MGNEYYDIFIETTSHSDCMKACDENYRDEEGEKIPGYGACRFRCWVDTAIKILPILVPIIIG